MAISNKKDFKFDWTNQEILSEGISHSFINNYKSSKYECLEDCFVISESVYKSELLRELYGY